MRYPSRNPVSPSPRYSETGSVSLGLLSVVLVLTGAGISALGYGWIARSKMALQLRLDRCVESRIRSVLRIQNQIEASNRRMTIERGAAVAAAIPTGGASIRAVKIALTAEQIFQETLRAKWRAEQATWILRRGCDGRGDLFFPLPALRWWRPPNDPLGPRPLRWEKLKGSGGANDQLAIRLWKTNRFSQAAFYRTEGPGDGKWEARWISRARK